MATYYHGSRNETLPSGRVFFAQDRDYASGYGEHLHTVEIDESTLRILDLSSVIANADTDYDWGRAMELCEAAGIDVSAINPDDSEGHGLVQQLCDHALLVKFDAVKIYEWTLYVGETVSLCVLNFA